MLSVLISGIFIASVSVFIIAYYNYIANFHRIQLYGRPKRKISSYTDFLPSFDLMDIFIGKEDPRILQLLMMRKLPVVVCLGDSITHGIISTNYVEQLQQKYTGKLLFVNSGINGNLAYNLNQRLKPDCIDLNPDFITILIGTNDVNSNKDAITLARYMRFQKLPCKPDYAFFISNLEEIIKQLQKTTKARIALLSLPVIGEKLNSRLNKLAMKYSEGIKELAARNKVSYLALNEKQRSYLDTNPKCKPGSYKKKYMVRNFLLMMGRSFDKIAAIHGRCLTYDDLHETTLGAGMITDLITHWLDQCSKTTVQARIKSKIADIH